MGKKLYVGNLAYGVTDSDLQQMFGAHGTVQSAQVIMDRDTGRSKGFGFVEMGSDQEAQAAIAGPQRQGGRRPRPDRQRGHGPRPKAAAAAAVVAAAAGAATAAAAAAGAATAAVAAAGAAPVAVGNTKSRTSASPYPFY